MAELRAYAAAMPDPYKPSEFGGKVQKNRVQPAPHVPTQSERMMLLYTTGNESGRSDPDNGEAFSGLVPLDRAKELALARGVSFEVGQAWDTLQTEADAVIAELDVPQ